MTIRIRLLIVLLVTALAPLVLTALTHQVAIHMAKKELTQTLTQRLDANARLALQELHQSHVTLLQKDRQLSEALLAYQAGEIERAFAQNSMPVAKAAELNRSNATFGYDPNLVVDADAVHSYYRDANDPNVARLHIDYQRQSIMMMPWSDPNVTEHLLPALASLTGIYQKVLQQAPPGVLWISTEINHAVFARYPASDIPMPEMPSSRPVEHNFRREPRSNFQRTPEGPRPPERPRRSESMVGRRPPGFDANDVPREGNWRRFSRRFRRSPVPIQVDPVTQQWVMQSSAEFSFTTNDGTEMRGQTTLARTIPEVFKDMALPERWGHETEHMLIRVDPNDPNATHVERLLHDKQAHYEDDRDRGLRPPWMRPQLTPLTSNDRDSFIYMMHDLIAGRAGTQVMDYQGRSCLWAYQPLDISQVGAILIVPYDRVTELASTLEVSLINESLLWLQITTVVLVLAAVLAVVLALRKARRLIQPITALIMAGRQLSAGDYDARVTVQADDELGQLGHVFNGIGPKLKEREAMKESLALAGVIQQSLLPQETPDLQNFEVHGRCLYCDETGGDYYDFVDLSPVHPHKTSIVLGDVSGHGITSALVMAATRGMMHAEIKHSACDLVKLFDTLNHQILHDTEVGTFVTLFHGILDDRNRSFIWASAGHEPAFWLHAQSGQIEELPNTGMPLGIHDEAVFDQAGPVTPEPGDLLVIGSDGIWEARDEHQEFFGKDRFFKVLKDHTQDPAEDICSAVIDRVAAFIGPGRRTDDITLIVIKSR